MSSRTNTFTVSPVFAARCAELPEAITQGKTEAGALKNTREATELVLENSGEKVRREGAKPVHLVSGRSRLPVVSGKQVQALHRVRFEAARQRSRHVFLRHPDGPRTVVPPWDREVDLLLRIISKDAPYVPTIENRLLPS